MLTWSEVFDSFLHSFDRSSQLGPMITRHKKMHASIFTTRMPIAALVLAAGLLVASGKTAFGAANPRSSLHRRVASSKNGFQWSRKLNETADDRTMSPAQSPTSVNGYSVPTTSSMTNDPSASIAVVSITESPSQVPSTAAPSGDPTVKVRIKFKMLLVRLSHEYEVTIVFSSTRFDVKPTESPSAFRVTVEPSSKPRDKVVCKLHLH